MATFDAEQQRQLFSFADSSLAAETMLRPYSGPDLQGHAATHDGVRLLIEEGRDPEATLAFLRESLDALPAKAREGRYREIAVHAGAHPDDPGVLGTYNNRRGRIGIYNGDGGDGLTRRTLYHEITHSHYPETKLSNMARDPAEMSGHWGGIVEHDQQLLDAGDEPYYSDSPLGPLNSPSAGGYISDYSRSFRERGRVERTLRAEEDFVESGGLYLVDHADGGFEATRDALVVSPRRGQWLTSGKQAEHRRFGEIYPTRAGYFDSYFNNDQSVLETARAATPEQFAEQGLNEVRASGSPLREQEWGDVRWLGEEPLSKIEADRRAAIADYSAAGGSAPLSPREQHLAPEGFSPLPEVTSTPEAALPEPAAPEIDWDFHAAPAVATPLQLRDYGIAPEPEFAAANWDAAPAPDGRPQLSSLEAVPASASAGDHGLDHGQEQSPSNGHSW